ncbi:MAG: hypothetical protein JWN94_3290 [Betaproteobacteria bacterium]|nr:hypothetical protein [Betaproteobacteria bacterium]
MNPAIEPREPVFVRIATGLLWLLLAFAVALALLLAFQAKSINVQGGWGWLMAASVFIAVAVVVCALCALSSAISLAKGEPHRRRSIAFLIVFGAVAFAGKGIAVGVVGGLYASYQESAAREAAKPGATHKEPALPPKVMATPVTALDPALLAHLRERGFELKPVAAGDDGRFEWLLANIEAGPGCEILTRIVQFAPGTSNQAMRDHMTRINAASMLNEQEGIAMFYPSASYKPDRGGNCDGWMAKSAQIATSLSDAFLSYGQPAIAVAPR